MRRMDFPVLTSETTGEQANDLDMLASNVNIILNILQDHRQHDNFELQNALNSCSTVINVCNLQTEDVNLFSTHSKVYQDLKSVGVSHEELSSQRSKYFSTLSTEDLKYLMFDVANIFRLLLVARKNLVDNVALISIFTNYNVTDIPSFNRAITEYFSKAYPMSYYCQQEYAIDVADEYRFSHLLKSIKFPNKRSYIKKGELIEICKESLIFKISINYDHLGLNIKTIKID
uniref:p26 protein n=1 Tax=Beet pseudoyellows virus TaxID=72750 RepID=A0A1B4XTH4_9CLOS|nr:p26 protein [Beet pseudoyellows virus]